MEEKVLNNLFEKARNTPSEVSPLDIQKWIGYGALFLFFFSIFLKFKSIFTLKLSIMISTISSVLVGTALVFTLTQKQTVQTESVANRTKTEKPLPKKPSLTLLKTEKSSKVNVKKKNEPFLLPIQKPAEVELPTPDRVTPVFSEIIPKKESNIKEFHSIKISGASTVFIQQGSEYKVEIEGDEKGKSYASFEVVMGKLIIKTVTKEKNVTNYKLTYYVTVQDLKEISISGASSIETKSRMAMDDLKITSSGASDIKLDLELQSLSGNISGASNLNLKGKTASLNLICSGASNVEMKDFRIEKAKISCSGASDLKLNVSNTLDLEVSGASDVKLFGSPQVLNKSVTGASSFRQYP